MPELPEVEITARRLDAALRGARIASAAAPGIATLKTFDPPLEALAGLEIDRVRRRGKNLIVEAGDLALLVHLMQAGRLGVFDKPASPRDKRVRLVVRLEDGHELRLREFGTRQRAWVKLLPAAEVEGDEALTKLGPEAFPAPSPEVFAAAIDEPSHLHTLLRNQRALAGIGRSWADEILNEARLSPFKQGTELEPSETERLRVATEANLSRALEHYEQVVGEKVPDKLPMPLRVHGRAGEPCPRCGEELRAVHFEDYTIAYCPACQTGGKVLKDRRLSKLLR